MSATRTVTLSPRGRQKTLHKEKQMALQNVRVEYSAEATVNLQNYENVKPGLKVAADVPEGGSIKDTVNELVELVDAFILHAVTEAKKGN